MKCLLITYLNSESLIENIESIMEYYKFSIIESNKNCRVFSGHYKGSAFQLGDRLNTELADADFDIEDSLFIVYPIIADNGRASITNLIIKRKGNKYLRIKIAK